MTLSILPCTVVSQHPTDGAPGACFSKTLTVSWGPRTEILQDFHKDCVETSHEIEDTKL